jgi:hypothetical protein
MTKNLILMLVIGSFFGLQSVRAQKQVEIVTPKADFDVEMATKMLNAGKSEIKGEAFYEERAGLIQRKIGDSIYARVGTVVTLYPVTPYLSEFFELRKKDKKGKRMAAISREVNSFRILTKVYSLKGEFVFRGLAPGKYYVETTVYFSSGIGGPEVSGIAEIRTDGETVNVVLKKTF